MKATEETSHGTILEAYANGDIFLSGEACVDPTGLDLSVLCNKLATDEGWKASLAAEISGQKENAHEWTGHLESPAVT